MAAFPTIVREDEGMKQGAFDGAPGIVLWLLAGSVKDRALDNI
jgi:hypothetical protein